MRLLHLVKGGQDGQTTLEFGSILAILSTAMIITLIFFEISFTSYYHELESALNGLLH